MSWLETNFIPGSRSYVLNAPESERYWDSLHHTCMIWSVAMFAWDTSESSPRLAKELFNGYAPDTFKAESFWFVDLYHKKLNRSWSGRVYTPWSAINCVSRDQYLAFILACSIFGVHREICRQLFYTLARNWFFYPNTYAIKDGKLIKKKWWQLPDFAFPWHLGDYYRATGLWYLWPFKVLSDLCLPIEALTAALSKNQTDHVKFVVKCVHLDINGNLLGKLASFIFINLRRNGKRSDGFIIDSYGHGHAVLNVWQCYWREDAGHAKEVYELSEPLLKWWIARYQ